MKPYTSPKVKKQLFLDEIMAKETDIDSLGVFHQKTIMSLPQDTYPLTGNSKFPVHGTPEEYPCFVGSIAPECDSNGNDGVLGNHGNDILYNHYTLKSNDLDGEIKPKEHTPLLNALPIQPPINRFCRKFCGTIECKYQGCWKQ